MVKLIAALFRAKVRRSKVDPKPLASFVTENGSDSPFFQWLTAAGISLESLLKALLADLQLQFKRINRTHLSKIANGLVASVSFHPLEVESKTGGDLGLVFIRPDVHRNRFDAEVLEVKREYKRGLLVQAKIFQRHSKWQALSPTQQKLLKSRLSYLALLLYRFLDQTGERRDLEVFKWQVAENATIKKINSWLKSGDFPELWNSEDILEALGSDRIGTDDAGIIDSEIAPGKLRPALHWKPGTPPPPALISVRQSKTLPRQQEVVRAQ
jgi:hypothetical protein